MSDLRSSFFPALFTCLLFLAVGLPATASAGGDEPGDDDPVDADGDGFDATEDCDDEDEDVNPDAAEVCDDGVDNDCDGVEWVAGQDLDGDGESPDASGCDGSDCDDEDASLNSDDLDGDLVTTCNGDCDDSIETGAAAGPGLEEICGDAIDNDCSGAADDEDLDSDGSLSIPCGGDDCDDLNATTNPEAGESEATCGDGVDNDCDTFVDEFDGDCFEEPEVDAGFDQQGRYLGGNIVIAFDGSGTTDGNEADVLSYAWTLAPDFTVDDDVTFTFITDPVSPYAFLRFHAAPGSAATSWDFTATLVVSDGVHTSDPTDEGATARAHIYRPAAYPDVGCSVVGGDGEAIPGLALLLLLAGLRRRRQQ